MVDFSEALRAKIESMSPDELAATEVRRLSREAERTRLKILEAVWEPARGGKGPSAKKDVTVRIDAAVAPAADDILRISHEPSFHESIILVPSAYRLIAGGPDGASRTNLAAPERFTVHAGSAGSDKVSVDRTALAVILTHERPAEMARARRLLELEARDAVHDIPGAKRVALFEDRWEAETIRLRIETVIANVPSRAVLLLAGRDHVALWVRREDLAVGPGRVLGSALASTIVRPDRLQSRPGVVVAPVGGANAPYLASTFGSGPERSLVLDVAKLKKLIPSLPHKEARDMAVNLVERLVDRSAAIARERAARVEHSVRDCIKARG